MMISGLLVLRPHNYWMRDGGGPAIVILIWCCCSSNTVLCSGCALKEVTPTETMWGVMCEAVSQIWLSHRLSGGGSSKVSGKVLWGV